jgi:tetratricopeptide (TPR) repeat protein
LNPVPLLLFLLPSALLADQVFLRDAGSITGKIVEQTATNVRVDVGGGVIGVPMDRVDRIVKGRCALDDYNDRAKKLGPNDVDGWKKLGRWASQEGLRAQAQDAYKQVLKSAPNDPQANEAMGLVQLNGRWVTETESFQARGFVEYDGEWMTPAQAQVAQTQAANDQARRDAEQRARDAEAATRDAEERAKEAEERAEESERYSSPMYWGGWGYGVTAWPSGTAPDPVFTPRSQIKVQTHR